MTPVRQYLLLDLAAELRCAAYLLKRSAGDAKRHAPDLVRSIREHHRAVAALAREVHAVAEQGGEP